MKILKKKTEKLTNRKGITLIALVITIIVLLILAGVTISALSGENGILKNVGKAKDEQINSTVKEAIISAWNEYQMELQLSNRKSTEDGIKVASTEEIQFQAELKNSLISSSMNFIDYLREEKKVINEYGVINVEALTGQKAHRGNGTDGVTDVYKIEINEENNEYTLKYYGEASEEPKSLLTLEDKNTKDESSEIVEPENSDDWEYTVSDGVATLTKYLGDDEILIVPNYIDGIPVKQVGDGTNQVWDENNTDYVTIINVTSMFTEHFQTRIKQIKISEGIEIIGQSCFGNLSNLEEVSIPSSINSIDDGAFGCSGYYYEPFRVMTLKIPKTVINLGNYIVGVGDSIQVEFKNESEIPSTWSENWNKISVGWGPEDIKEIIWAQ